MHMCRPVTVPPQQHQQLADRPVVRDRVADGLDPLEPEPPLLVAHEDATLARLAAVRVLHVVVPAAVGLPDVDFHTGHGVALGVFDGADREHGLALGVARHARAVGQGRRVVRVEGPQEGALCGVGRLRVVYAVDQEGQAKDVREEDEFLGAHWVNKRCLQWAAFPWGNFAWSHPQG